MIIVSLKLDNLLEQFYDTTRERDVLSELLNRDKILSNDLYVDF